MYDGDVQIALPGRGALGAKSVQPLTGREAMRQSLLSSGLFPFSQFSCNLLRKSSSGQTSHNIRRVWPLTELRSLVALTC